MMPGYHIIVYQLLIEKYILPPLQEALNQTKPCFQYLKVIFHKPSDVKIKVGIFVGPQVRQILDNENFQSTMNEGELSFTASELYSKDLIKRILIKIKQQRQLNKMSIINRIMVNTTR